jgi:aryl-alcohol dehydrogenase-like predicted oxidoreductase
VNNSAARPEGVLSGVNGVPRIELRGGYEISRIIKGGWQLAGDHGPVDPAKAPDEMAEFVRAGMTTFDCADIYTGVEAMIGEFRARYPDLAKGVRVHTKFVPDLAALGRIDGGYVVRAIDRSLQRLRLEQLDLVQLHWWDYAVPGYVETALELERLRKQGKIANIGGTNFDVPHLAEIRRAGVPILTHQVQYSLLDARPEQGMVEYCRENDIGLLCYGTVAGGFLSDRWLAVAEPTAAPVNRSLVKYKLIIDDFGGWNLFQRLLWVLRDIADRHGCDISTVASAAVLARSGVAAVIVGATNTSHLESNRRIGSLGLQRQELAAIEEVLQQRTGPNGDVYTLERDRHGRHGRIMKYDLNK